MEREEINFVFQFADLVQLEKLYNKIDKELGVNVINQPTSQTLLVPIKDPLSGGEFYAGEALVTSCIVEVDKVQGWSMVQDNNSLLSLYIATIDAVFDRGEFSNEIKNLYIQVREKLEDENKKTNQKVNATKVNFDLM
jgi:alpha-D-ribose 1-methylphosphonate 5-triphosphate synthase subunit PhnG